RLGRFDHEQRLAFALHGSLPAKRRHDVGDRIDARREPPLDERVRQSLRLRLSRASGQHHDLAIAQRRLLRTMTSAEAYPPPSPGVMTPISKSLEIGVSITMIGTLFRRVLTDERRCARIFR